MLRKSTATICIYCGETRPEPFRGVEHVIQQSFGTFADQTPTLRCVCDGCNEFFKKELDQVFARETLEGITRYKKGIYSRESRQQRRLRIVLPHTDGTGGVAGVVTWIDGRTGNLILPLQVHFQRADNGEYVPIFKDEVRGLDWRGQGYSDRGIKIFANSRDEYEETVRLLDAIGIKFVRKSETPVQLSGDGKLAVEIEGTIDHVVKRAICKILFNFASKYLGANEVLKPEWDKARRYVRFNSEPLKARVSRKPFWGEELANWRFECDSYNLRVENHERGVIGALQMFNLNTYEIILLELQVIRGSRNEIYARRATFSSAKDDSSGACSVRAESTNLVDLRPDLIGYFIISSWAANPQILYSRCTALVKLCGPTSTRTNMCDGFARIGTNCVLGRSQMQESFGSRRILKMTSRNS